MDGSGVAVGDGAGVSVGGTSVNVGVLVGMGVSVGVAVGGTGVNVGREVAVGRTDTAACCCPPKEQAATLRKKTAGMPHWERNLVTLWLLHDCNRVLAIEYGQV